MASPRASDAGAVFTGLVVGSCVIFVFVFGMVKWTAATHSQHTPAESTK